MPCEMVEHLDHVVLFTGDGDFRALVAAMQRKGARVTVVSTVQTQPPMVADELRRQADQFIDLADLEDQVCRDPAPAPCVSRGSGTRPPARGAAPAALDFPEEDDEGTRKECCTPPLWVAPRPGHEPASRPKLRAIVRCARGWSPSGLPTRRASHPGSTARFPRSAIRARA